jgi:hypothetical protein
MITTFILFKGRLILTETLNLILLNSISTSTISVLKDFPVTFKISILNLTEKTLRNFKVKKNRINIRYFMLNFTFLMILIYLKLKSSIKKDLNEFDNDTDGKINYVYFLIFISTTLVIPKLIINFFDNCPANF